MAAIIWEDVVGVASELGATGKVSLIARDIILQLANSFLNVTNWGGEASPKLKAGRVYFAAHLATMGSRKGVIGAIASSSAGGLQRSYSNPTLNTNSTLQTTPYGLIYMQLAKTTPGRAGLSLNGGGKTPTDTGWDG